MDETAPSVCSKGADEFKSSRRTPGPATVRAFAFPEQGRRTGDGPGVCLSGATTAHQRRSGRLLFQNTKRIAPIGHGSFGRRNRAAVYPLRIRVPPARARSAKQEV